MTDTKIDLFTIDTEELIKIVSEESFFKPINYFFLLAMPTIEEKTRGGLILAQESIDKSSIGNNVGRVVGIGKTVGGATGAYEECKELKIGDYVGYNPHAGLPFPHDSCYSNCTFICLGDDGFRLRINDISKHTDGIFKTYNVRGVN